MQILANLVNHVLGTNLAMLSSLSCSTVLICMNVDCGWNSN